MNFKDIIKSKPFTARFKNKSSALLDKDVTSTVTNSQYKFRSCAIEKYWLLILE